MEYEKYIFQKNSSDTHKFSKTNSKDIVSYINDHVVPQPTFGIKEKNYYILAIHKSQNPGSAYSIDYQTNRAEYFYEKELDNFKILVVATQLPGQNSGMDKEGAWYFLMYSVFYRVTEKMNILDC